MGLSPLMVPESGVAAELFTALERYRQQKKLTQKLLAEALKVGESVLSKRLADRSTPPDDGWVVRVGRLVELPAERIEDLIVEANLEKAYSNPVGRRYWEGIRGRLLRPKAVVSQAIPDWRILSGALTALGLSLSEQEVKKVAVKAFKREPITSITNMEGFKQLRDCITEYFRSRNSSFTPPSLVRLAGHMWHGLNVRLIAPTDFRAPFCWWLGKMKTSECEMRSLPIFPGLIGHLIRFGPGGAAESHSHRGVECVVVLEGTVEIIFEHDAVHKLTAAEHQILLYNSEMYHGAQSKDGALLAVVHFDPKLIDKWPLVMREFWPEESAEVQTGNHEHAP